MTKRKIIKRTVIILIVLIAIAFGAIYLWSTILLNKSYDMALTDIPIPDDAASIAEGARLTRIEHCGDCHGENLNGAVFKDIPANVATLVAPNLTKVIPTYTNAEIVRLLRYGIKKNGHSIYIMPAFMYHELKEESLGKIIAYLRTLKPQPDPPGLPAKSSFALLGRLIIIQKKVTPIADMITPGKGKYVDCDTTAFSYGRYLTASSCTSCHGSDLKGEAGFSPDLIIAASYKKEDFFKLIRTGVAQGDRKNIGLMTNVTKNYLSHLNDHEIECIYAYLQTKPTQSKTQK